MQRKEAQTRTPVPHESKIGLPAAQLAVIVLDVTVATVVIVQRGVSPLAILLLATGPESIAGNGNVLAGLGVRAVRKAIVVSVAIPVPIAVMVAIPVTVAIMVIVAATIVTRALEAAVQVLDFSTAAVIVLKLGIAPFIVSVFASGIQGRSPHTNVLTGLLVGT